MLSPFNDFFLKSHEDRFCCQKHCGLSQHHLFWSGFDPLRINDGLIHPGSFLLCLAPLFLSHFQLGIRTHLDGASSPIPLFLREASPKCVSSVTKVSCYVPLAHATLHPQRTMSWMGHSSQSNRIAWGAWGRLARNG